MDPSFDATSTAHLAAMMDPSALDLNVNMDLSGIMGGSGLNMGADSLNMGVDLNGDHLSGAGNTASVSDEMNLRALKASKGIKSEKDKKDLKEKAKESKEKTEKTIKTNGKKGKDGGKAGAKKANKGSGINGKKGGLSFNTYIHKVLRQVHPSIGITKQGMSVLNDLVCNAFYQISEEAGKLVKMDNRDTLSARDINSAVRLILPGELAQHSNDEGTSALKHYESNTKKNRDD